MLSLDLGQPDEGRDFRRHLVSSMNAAIGNPIRLRAGFAYATRSGVDQLLESLGGNVAWSEASKLWLLGVHHGITEPEAITALANLPSSTVRIATCGLPIRQAIEGQRIFHAKIIAVDSGTRHKINALMAGSANLTRAAIGSHARNYEAGMTWTSSVEEAVSRYFDSWWEGAWHSGIKLNPKNLETYIDQRTRFLIRNPDIITTEPQETSSWAGSARALWIEAGAMSTGGSHNAVDLNRELASFFGPVSNQTRHLTLFSAGQHWTNRPLSPKTTTLQVNLWRLSLPTVAMGGFDYRYRIIRFTKVTNEHSALEFQLEVADTDSGDVHSWQMESGRHGFIGRTGGGHTFGFM